MSLTSGATVRSIGLEECTGGPRCEAYECAPRPPGTARRDHWVKPVWPADRCRWGIRKPGADQFCSNNPGQVAQLRGGISVRQGSTVLEPEANLHSDLDVLYLTILGLATNLGDFEPVNVA